MLGLQQVEHQRFWEKVAISNNPQACWLWTSGTNPMGYGRLNVAGKPVLAHRFSYLIHYGPTALCVLHRCDVPACVNPVHLWAGTRQENNRDRDDKGRLNPGRLPGSSHHQAKLVEEQVVEMRALFAAGASNRELAALYGVSYYTAWDITSGRSWRHC